MNAPDTIQKGISVLVDGGCKNHNRPASERKTYGSMTVFWDGKQVASRYAIKPENTLSGDGEPKVVHRFDVNLPEDYRTINIVEMAMLRTALRYAVQYVERRKHNKRSLPDHITVLSDSEWALNVLTGVYQMKPETELRFNNFLQDIKLYKRLLKKEGCQVLFQHVNRNWVEQVLGH
jgi:hypothetical protein